jgi:hypothetical protein
MEMAVIITTGTAIAIDFLIFPLPKTVINSTMVVVTDLHAKNGPW